MGPFPQWKKIVSLDPLGHLSPWKFSDLMRDENIHIRPSIAITKAVRILRSPVFSILSLEACLQKFPVLEFSRRLKFHHML